MSSMWSPTASRSATSLVGTRVPSIHGAPAWTLGLSHTPFAGRQMEAWRSEPNSIGFSSSSAVVRQCVKTGINNVCDRELAPIC